MRGRSSRISNRWQFPTSLICLAVVTVVRHKHGGNNFLFITPCSNCASARYGDQPYFGSRDNLIDFRLPVLFG